MNHQPSDDDPFIDRLRAQPFTSLPAAWRSEILGVAVAAVPSPPPRRRRIGTALREWLWPHPLAYAGLLVVWTMTLALRWQTPLPAWRQTNQPVASIDSVSNGLRGTSLLLSAHDVNEDLAIRQQFLTRNFAEEGRP